MLYQSTAERAIDYVCLQVKPKKVEARDLLNGVDEVRVLCLLSLSSHPVQQLGFGNIFIHTLIQPTSLFYLCSWQQVHLVFDQVFPQLAARGLLKFRQKMRLYY